jgi:Tripartite tricarboxylate transporter family receptor
LVPRSPPIPTAPSRSWCPIRRAASDIIARILAASLQGAIGGSVVVENKGGGGSNIGMGYVARADGDGYTGDQRLAVNPGLYETLPYDPFKDFAPPCYFNGTEEGPSGEDIVGIRVFPAGFQ